MNSTRRRRQKSEFNECSVKIDERTICGTKVDTQESCVAKGCCYSPTENTEVRCYFKLVDWRKRLYPFTNNSEEILVGQDDTTYKVTNLPFPLPYCKNAEATTLYICTNGLISLDNNYCPYEPNQFGTELKAIHPVFAPFYSDLTLTPPSNVDEYFSTITKRLAIRGNLQDDGILQRAAEDVAKLSNNTYFEPVWVYIVTWYNVRAWGSTEGVTFQIAIITSGLQTFIRFSYGQMLWATFYKPAQVGFNVSTEYSDCKGSLNVPLNEHTPFRYPLEKIIGNIGEKGVWMYEITEKIKIEEDLNKINITMTTAGQALVVNGILSANDGDQLKLFCSISKPTNAAYVWYKDDVILEQTSSLFNKVITLEDTGRYKCGLQKEDQTKKSEIEIFVNVKRLDKPVLLFEPSESNSLGSFISVTCVSKAYPNPKYKWYHEGEELKLSDSLIVLRNVTWEDSGYYQCEITNSVGSQKSDIIALVLWELYSPTVTSNIEGYINIDSYVSLSCSSSNNVQTELLWWSDNGRINTINNSNVLTFEKIKSKDSGKYWCTSSKQDVVKESRKVELVVTYLNETVVYSQPSNTFKSGENITLVCQTHSYPPPSVYTWYYENKQLQNVSTDTLQLRNVTKTSNGKYTCKINHLLGISEASFHLQTSYCEKPTITKSWLTNYIAVDSNISFCCILNSSPVATISWNRNKQRLNTTSNCISINNVSFEESGKYYCYAENSAGNSSAGPISVNVGYINVPSISLNNSTISSNQMYYARGDNITYICNNTAFPLLDNNSIVWKRNGEFIQNGSTLNLLMLQPLDSGYYQCITTNEAAYSTANVNIFVADMSYPEIKVHPSSNLYEGEDVIIQCTFSSSLTMNYTWLKDGQPLDGEFSSLINLTKISRNYSGNYVCITESEVGRRISTNTFLNVNYLDHFSITSLPNGNHFKEGDSIRLTVETEGNHTLRDNQLLWYHDGHVLSTGRNFTLRNVTSNMSGLYQVIIGTINKERIASHYLNIEYLGKPTLSKYPKIATSKGSNMFLKCSVESSENLEYIWFKDNILLYEENDNTLILTNLTQEKMGEYYCQVSTQLQTKVSDSLNINFHDNDNIKISIEPSHVNSTLGDNLTLSCFYNTSSDVQYRWWFNNKQLISTNSQFVITKLTVDDFGNYLCQVVINDTNVAQDDVEIITSYMYSPKIISLTPSPVLNGSSLLLQCISNASSSSSVQIKWYHNDLKLQNTEEYLAVPTLTNNHSGEYYCMTSNGEMSKKSEIYPVSFNYLTEPELTMGVSDTIVDNSLTKMAGEAVNLTCFSTGSPKPHFKWLHNNKLIKNSSNLVISNLSIADGGHYECVASNMVQEKRKQISLQVDYLTTPLLYMSPESVIKKGDSVFFHCDSTGFSPTFYQWHLNGQLLPHETQWLLINNIDHSNNGSYECVVRNNAGMKISNSLKLDFVYLDKPTLLIQNVTSLKSRVSVTANGRPEPEYKWLVDNQVISQNTTVIVNSSDLSKLTLVASNQANTFEIGAALSKEQYLNQPEIRLLPSTDIWEGETVVLTCDVEGSPPLVHKWFKDGLDLNYFGTVFLITNVTEQDRGEYQCMVENDVTKKTSPKMLVDVKYLTTPLINVSNRLNEISVGDNVTFNCSTMSSSSLTSFKWYHGERLIGTTQRLVLANVTLNNSGEYRCEVELMNRTKTKTISFDTKYHSQPQLSVLPDTIIREGNTVVFTCKPSSSDVTNYQWFHNGRLIVGVYSAEYTIHNVNRTDRGNYSCATSNQLGNKSSSETSITVAYMDDPLIITSNEMLLVNDSVFMTALVNAVPEPNSYRWIFNDTVISTEPFVAIEAVNRSQSGIYTLQVSNSYIERIAKKNVVVYYMEKPTIKPCPTTSTIPEGYSTTLICQKVSNLPISYIWLKDNDVISNSTQSDLTIVNVNQSDAGDYQCATIYNLTRRIADSYSIYVAYLDEPRISGSNGTIAEHSNLILHCLSNGYPSPSVTWYHNDVILNHTTTSQLLLQNLSRSDDGEYRCNVKNKFVEKVAKIPIKVQYLGTPIITMSPSTNHNEGDAVLLNCYAESSDRVSYTWFHKGNLLPGRSATLLLNRITRDDSGLYTCLAETNFASKKADTVIDVYYLDEPIIASYNSSLSTVNLTCMATGNPIPERHWVTPDDVIISNESSIVVSYANVTEYACVVKNSVREVRITEDTSSNKFLNTPMLLISPDNTINEGEFTVLSCQGDGTLPLVFSWMFNNTHLNFTTSLVVLNDVDRAMIGLYRCTTENVLGRKTSESVLLTVNYLDEVKINSTHDTSLTYENDTISLACVARGLPTPTFTWFKDNHLLQYGEQLQLENIQISSIGKYKCTANNGYLMKSKAIDLVVHYLSLPCVSSMLTTKPLINLSFILHCEVNSSRSLTYQWLKNNVNITNATTNDFFVIEQLQLRDDGSYQCIAFDGIHTKISKPYEVQSLFLNNPLINVSSISSTIDALVCTAHAYPPVTVVWLRNGDYFSNSSRIQVDKSKDIRNAEYKCIARSLVGEKQAAVTVFSKAHYSPNLIINPMKNLIEGDSMILTCHANSTSPSQSLAYSWYHNSLLLPHNESMLIYNNIKRHQSGLFYCKTSIGDGWKISNNITVEVYYLDSPIITNISSTNITSTKSCFARGFPQPNITWYDNDDEKLLSNNPILTLNTSTIPLTYKCVASNLAGRKEVVVREELQCYSEKRKIELYMAKPVLSASSVLPRENDNLMLVCLTTSSQPVIYSWFYNNTLLKNCSTSIYLIENITRLNTGVYHCTTQMNGTVTLASDRIHIAVSYLDSLEIKHFSTSNTTDVKICFVSGYPQPSVIWYHDDKLISNNSLLTLNKSMKSSTYKCVAYNSAGSKETIFRTEVQCLSEQREIELYMAKPVLSVSSVLPRENDNLMLVCLTTSSHSVIYSWFYNNTLLKNCSTSMYLIENITRLNTGVYHCTTQMNGTMTQESNPIHIAVSYLFDINIISSQAKYNLGDTIILSCFAPGWPSIVYTWTKQDRFISQNDTLVINSTTLSDEGTYQCEADNGDFEKTLSIDIKLEYLNTPSVRIVPSHIVNENDAIHLQCLLNASQPLKITWYKDYRLLPWHQESHMIYSVQRKDMGNYSCEVSNGRGVKMSNITMLQVQYLSVPSITKTVTNNTTLFKCSVESYPRVQYLWYRNNIMINNDTGNELLLNHVDLTTKDMITCKVVNAVGSRFISTSKQYVHISEPVLQALPSPQIQENTTLLLICTNSADSSLVTFLWYFNDRLVNTSGSMLIFNEVQRGEQGGYRCSVSNGNEEKKSKTTLVEVQYIDTPQIFKSLSPKENIEDVHLSCNTTGNPLPLKYYWTKDSKIIHTEASLSLDSVEDSGLYVCHVENESGKNEISIDVQMRYLYKPKLTKISPSHPHEGEDITLECLVNGSKPLLYNWTKNNEPFYTSRTSSYIIRNASRDIYDGVYKCIVNNDYGHKISESLNIEVAYFDQPIISLEPKTDEISEMENVTLHVSNSSNQLSMITWYKDDVAMGTGYQLDLQNINNSMSGVYMAVVENKLGAKSATMNLKINYHRQPTLSISGNLTVAEHNNFSIQCNSDTSFSHGSLTYGWLKDNVSVDVNVSTLHLESVSVNDIGVYTCFTSIRGNDRKRSINQLRLAIQEDSTPMNIPVCGLNEKLTLNAGLLQCACVDGYLGENCLIKSLSSQATVSLKQVCFKENCTAGSELASSLENVYFYDKFKSEFEGSVLAALQEELSPSMALGLKLLKHRPNKLQDEVQLDFFLYFNASSNISVSEVNDYLALSLLKHFVNNADSSRDQTDSAIFNFDPHSIEVFDYDHCSLSQTLCHENATCLNGKMTFYCRCNDGYEGNGFDCRLVTTCFGNGKVGATNGESSTAYELSTYILGAFVLSLLLCCLCCYFCCCYKRKQKKRKICKKRKMLPLVSSPWYPVSNDELVKKRSTTVPISRQQEREFNDLKRSSEQTFTTFNDQFNGYVSFNDGFSDDDHHTASQEFCMSPRDVIRRRDDIPFTGLSTSHVDLFTKQNKQRRGSNFSTSSFIQNLTKSPCLSYQSGPAIYTPPLSSNRKIYAKQVSNDSILARNEEAEILSPLAMSRSTSAPELVKSDEADGSPLNLIKVTNIDQIDDFSSNADSLSENACFDVVPPLDGSSNGGTSSQDAYLASDRAELRRFSTEMVIEPHRSAKERMKVDGRRKTMKRSDDDQSQVMTNRQGNFVTSTMIDYGSESVKYRIQQRSKSEPNLLETGINRLRQTQPQRIVSSKTVLLTPKPVRGRETVHTPEENTVIAAKAQRGQDIPSDDLRMNCEPFYENERVVANLNDYISYSKFSSRKPFYGGRKERISFGDVDYMSNFYVVSPEKRVNTQLPRRIRQKYDANNPPPKPKRQNVGKKYSNVDPNTVHLGVDGIYRQLPETVVRSTAKTITNPFYYGVTNYFDSDIQHEKARHIQITNPFYKPDIDL